MVGSTNSEAPGKLIKIYYFFFTRIKMSFEFKKNGKTNMFFIKKIEIFKMRNYLFF
jgi:hypothetical protein